MTGSELDKLVIKIVADTKQLTAGLNKVKGDLGGVGNQSAKTGDRAKRSFGGMKAKLLAVAAAGAVVTQALKKIAGAGMVFEDLKDSLDISESVKAYKTPDVPPVTATSPIFKIFKVIALFG